MGDPCPVTENIHIPENAPPFLWTGLGAHQQNVLPDTLLFYSSLHLLLLHFHQVSCCCVPESGRLSASSHCVQTNTWGLDPEEEAPERELQFPPFTDDKPHSEMAKGLPHRHKGINMVSPRSLDSFFGMTSINSAGSPISVFLYTYIAGGVRGVVSIAPSICAICVDMLLDMY